MQLTRQEKEDLVASLAAKIDDHPVVGILDMHSLPARQLQEIKKELVGDVEIRMTRKTLIERALDAAETDGIDALADNDATMPALLFTEENPFALFKLIQEKKSSAPASGGETAPTDIEIPDGKTGLDPGPMLGRLQSLGADTSVEDGEIAVAESVVAVEAGKTIDADTAEILNNLGIEPLEVGLDLKLVFEGGEVFDRSVLEIDTEAYRADVEAAASQAFNLAVNAGVMNDTTAETVVVNATSKARNLAVNAGIVDEEVIEDLVRKAAGAASAVDAELDLENVEVPGDDGDATDDGGESDRADESNADEEASGDTPDGDDSDDETPSDDDDEEADADGGQTDDDDDTEVN